jgi:hypothetical protein
LQAFSLSLLRSTTCIAHSKLELSREVDLSTQKNSPL